MPIPDLKTDKYGYGREPSPVELHVERELHFKDRNYSWTVRQQPCDLVVVWCERLGCVTRNEFSARELSRTLSPGGSERGIISGINFFYDRCTYELNNEPKVLWNHIEELTHEMGVLNINLEMYRKSYGYNPLAEPEPLWTPRPGDHISAEMVEQKYSVGANFDQLKKDFADMEYRFGCMLDYVTGGMLSKTNYTVVGMQIAVDAHQWRCEEKACQEVTDDEKERADAAEEKCAQVEKDLDIALRENDRLMSRLNMEGCRTGLMAVSGVNERPQVVVQTEEDGDIG